MSICVAVIGAGGKMGLRTAINIGKYKDYEVLHVENSEIGMNRLKEQGLDVTSIEIAVQKAEIVILAVPDALLGKISSEIVPMLKSGSMVICLDPAAAHAKRLAHRQDISYFVAHPCHPPIFNDEITEEARNDHFGGLYAKQHIVCALFCGQEEDYQKGEKIAKAMYAPVMDAYRVTIEQMVILEPALVETLGVTILVAARKALEKAIDMGVPENAARAFFFGHLQVAIAQVFEFVEYPMSDGAKLAAELAFDKIFRPDWMDNVMNLDRIAESVAEITQPK